MTDDAELRRLLQEASEALLALNHAVHRRSAGIKHRPIAELMAKAGAAHEAMMWKLKERDLPGGKD